jgi:hypothetical protein
MQPIWLGILRNIGMFGVATDMEYERLAAQFLLAAGHADLLQCIRKHGDIVRYNRVTTEFGVLSAQGVIRTYFKPKPCRSLPKNVPKVDCHGYRDNFQYFHAECARW